MNNRERRYAYLMREGIEQAIRRAARAGFVVHQIQLRKVDLKLMKRINPTGSAIIAGTELVQAEPGDLKAKHFRLITNAPKGAPEMFEEAGLPLPEGGIRNWDKR